MSIALVSKITGDLETAFVVVQLIVVLGAVVGAYRFARIWTTREAAANASLLFVVSSSIAETVHLFGQLPTIWAICFLLNALPFLHSWIDKGRLGDLVSGIGLLAACTAGHHVTTLFGSVFFLGPIVVWLLLIHSRRSVASENTFVDPHRVTLQNIVPLFARRLRRTLPLLQRTFVLGITVIGTLVLVVLPYWLWSVRDPITQISIPHGSRQNFISEPNIGLVFFLIPWGVMLVALPYAIVKTFADGRWPLGASLGLLALLGTGGTTPVPRVLLGGAFDILTLDRFTFWATIMILPLAGELLVSLEAGALAANLRRLGGPVLAKTAQLLLTIFLVGCSVFASTLSQHRPFQPDRLDVDPIVAFLEKDQHERWRFLTLGFGDQMAWLSARTEATQVDGNYHSARRLPELISTPVERLEGAKYRGVDGLGSLRQFLEVPEKYHLKFVFSNDPFYDPLLHFAGWQRLGALENAVVVWERADIPPLPAQLPVREVPSWQRIMWGTVPIGAVGAALLITLFHLVGKPTVMRRRSRNGDHNNDHKNDQDSRALLIPLRWVDRWLEVLALQLKPAEHEVAERKRRSYLSRYAYRIIGALGAAGTILGLVLVLFGSPDERVDSAETTIEQYYDHLDFRRWNDAYEMLDPTTKPDFELWRLQQSVNGGIVASYAKLDSIESTVVYTPGNGETADATVNLQYLTALDHYDVTRTHRLRRQDKTWFIEADTADPTVPPEQLVRQAEVTYRIQGRRRVTSATTDLIDIQDRPELSIDSATLLSVDGSPVIVGRITNQDVDPADLTITGVLRDDENQIIASYNATQTASLTLLPRESTPFRVSFEEVAAGSNLDFDPTSFKPIEFSEDIAAAEVVAKAVVSDRGLYRGLGTSDVSITQLGDGSLRLDANLYNSGVEEVVVPRLLISFLDEEGNVLWVQNEYLAYSVRTQRSRSFAIPLDDVTSLKPIEFDVNRIDNGVAPQDEATNVPTGTIPAPAGYGFASVEVVVTGFEASEAS